MFVGLSCGIVELSIKLPGSLSKVGVGHPYRVRLLQGNLLITCLIAFRETVQLSGEVMGLGIDPRSGLSYRYPLRDSRGVISKRFFQGREFPRSKQVPGLGIYYNQDVVLLIVEWASFDLEREEQVGLERIKGSDFF